VLAGPTASCTGVFEQAQQIITTRGEDRTRHAASSSDNLLAGRVFSRLDFQQWSLPRPAPPGVPSR
jgi:hypothetical protein